MSDAATAANAAAAATAERKVLAERFKTKICRNYADTGFCPYESRCMFAHGEEDMRTAAMNVRDGLFTEEAIKAWKRAQRLVTRQGAAHHHAHAAAAPVAAAEPAAADTVIAAAPEEAAHVAPAQQQQQQRRRQPPQYETLYTGSSSNSGSGRDAGSADCSPAPVYRHYLLAAAEPAQQQQQQQQQQHAPFDALEMLRPATPEATDSECGEGPDAPYGGEQGDCECHPQEYDGYFGGEFPAYSGYDDGSYYGQPQPEEQGQEADRWFSSVTSSPVRYFRFNPYSMAAVDFVELPQPQAQAQAPPSAAKHVALVDDSASRASDAAGEDEVLCP